MNTDLNNKLFDNVLEHMDNFNNADDINSMINLKKNIHKDILLYRKNIEELQKLIDSIDKKLINKCNHNWKMDYSHYQEHSQFTCTVCGLYK